MDAEPPEVFALSESGREVRLEIATRGCTFYVIGSEQPAERVSLLEQLLRPYRVPLVRRTDVARAIARWWPNDTSEMARRIAFLRAWRPERVTPRQWSWQTTISGIAREERLAFSSEGVTRMRPHGGSVLVTPDDAFVHGPPAPGMPRGLREELRAALHTALDPDAAIHADAGFVDLDHARIAAATWTHDARDDGDASVAIGPGFVEMAYRYGHDDGSDTYAAERVVSDAPEILWSAPTAIRDEVIARISAACALE